MPDPDRDNQVEILERTSMFHDFVRLERVRLRHRLFNGDWTPAYARYVLFNSETSTAAVVLPYDPERDEILLIEQFRPASHLSQRLSGWILEAVAGLVDSGEIPEDAARRELREEAGCTARRLEKVATFLPSPGVFAEVAEIFVAEVDAGKSGRLHGLAEEQEDIRVHVLSVTKAVEMADTGVIEDGKTLFALNWFARHHEKIRQRWRTAE